MIRPLRSLSNENGSAIVMALMLLSLLTVMGIWSTRKSNIETLIAGNEVARKQTFYRTEGGVIEGGFAIEEAATGDLSSRAPVWLTEASVAPDMTDPANWDFDNVGGDDTAVATSNRSRGWLLCPGQGDYSGRLAAHDRYRARCAPTRCTVFTTAAMGQSLMEVGYKRRF